LFLRVKGQNRNSGVGPIIKDFVKALRVEANNLTMEQKYFIGIDISKQKIDVAIILSNYQVVIEKIVVNQDKNIASFFKGLMRKLKCSSSEILVCCETTGIYNKPLARVCIELNIDLWIEHALKIKFASSDLRGKSDRKDAMRIAEYCVRYQDRKHLYECPSVAIEELDTLCKVRETLLANKVGIENQLREAKSHDTRKFQQLKELFNRQLKSLEKDLRELELKIEEKLLENNEMRSNVELIKSVPGVGKRTAIQLVILTNNFKDFTSAKHLACYAGVVPFTNESGTIKKKPRISKKANLKLKTLLHLSAMAATRSKTELKQYFIRKVSEGKNKMSVINAIRNKLVHRIWAVIERQTPYVCQENFLTN
jgi:transposase